MLSHIYHHRLNGARCRSCDWLCLRLQDRLAYGPTFEGGVDFLFGGGASSLSSAGSPHSTTEPVNRVNPRADLRLALIAEAAKDFADYQR